ncbi:MAG: histidinol dehydrogenase [Gammaproteobacteria bacterium]|nr:histidinol dehydrogenase [Gammaproteobacteria bacterium]
MLTIYNARDWQRPQATVSSELFDSVRDILADINGADKEQKIDSLSQQFDNIIPQKIALQPYKYYAEHISPELYTTIETAATRIRRFCEFQRNQLQPASYRDETGEYGFVYCPMDSMGAYIPAGRFPLISSALMTLLPATVAGVKRRIAVSPSNHMAIQAAASLAGATDFYHIGGIQAIAALAYGYKTIQPVDIIVGPGNQYVNAAKQLLQQTVQIDGAAGPSELLVIADNSIDMQWLIADMAAQAEHDPQALSVVVSDDSDMLNSLRETLLSMTDLHPILTAEQIVLVYAEDKKECIEFSNRFAAEHLLLADDSINAEELTHFGSLFIGKASAVAYGDYCSGPNHTLPTSGHAKNQSGLSVHNFLKVQSCQTITENGAKELSKTGRPLAQAEGLVWHDKSMKVRG